MQFHLTPFPPKLCLIVNAGTSQGGNMESRNTALVLGAAGGIGGEIARQLRAAGWQIKALKRGVAREGVGADGLHWLRGDALDAADVMRAAEGCTVIVHAVNPPGYRDWDKLVLPMLDNTIAAARANKAMVVLPGTVYNFGPNAFPVLREDAPQHPATRKGAIRVRMEAALQTFAESGGRTLIVRAGDFFGPRAGNSWFAQGMVKPGRPPRFVLNPARRGTGHQWAYLPDVAATVVALIGKRDQLAPFAVYHMAGHWDPDGDAMVQAIARTLVRHGGRAPHAVRFPWWLARLAALVDTTMRELLEMRYLWQEPVRMDNARLRAVLGSEPHTPLDQAVEATLAGLDCLPGGKRELRAAIRSGR
jgi:nucleoside-diphosphate-sugar epimerase